MPAKVSRLSWLLNRLLCIGENFIPATCYEECDTSFD